jgi:hypothetical protein
MACAMSGNALRLIERWAAESRRAGCAEPRCNTRVGKRCRSKSSRFESESAAYDARCAMDFCRSADSALQRARQEDEKRSRSAAHPAASRCGTCVARCRRNRESAPQRHPSSCFLASSLPSPSPVSLRRPALLCGPLRSRLLGRRRAVCGRSVLVRLSAGARHSSAHDCKCTDIAVRTTGLPSTRRHGGIQWSH